MKDTPIPKKMYGKLYAKNEEEEQK